MGTRIVMVFWKTAPILALLGVTAASSVAGQEVDVTVVLYWGVEGEAPKRPFRRVEVVAQTFDIAAETLTVRALFRSRTVAERAAGGSGVLACRYRNRRAISEGSGGTLYWLDCDRERPEPQSFERLQHANVTIREGGRTYSTVCEDNLTVEWGSSVQAGSAFDCWLVNPTNPGQDESAPTLSTIGRRLLVHLLQIRANCVPWLFLPSLHRTQPRSVQELLGPHALPSVA